MNDTPVYFVEDAIEFICEQTGLNEEIVRVVLESEEEYMIHIGVMDDYR